MKYGGKLVSHALNMRKNKASVLILTDLKLTIAYSRGGEGSRSPLRRWMRKKMTTDNDL